MGKRKYQRTLDHTFMFMLSEEDRECLVRLARKAQRSMSDTLRLLIRDAYAKMLVVDKPTPVSPEDEQQED